jgi:hypothetical protein
MKNDTMKTTTALVDFSQRKRMFDEGQKGEEHGGAEEHAGEANASLFLYMGYMLPLTWLAVHLPRTLHRETYSQHSSGIMKNPFLGVWLVITNYMDGKRRILVVWAFGGIRSGCGLARAELEDYEGEKTLA